MNISSPTKILQVLSLCACSTVVSEANADNTHPDNFRIALGSYVVGRYDSNISLTESTLGAGASISPEDTLGLDLEQTVIRLDGYYRFNEKHALTYSWYGINTTGNKNVDQDFEWVNEDGQKIIVNAGAQVKTELEYDILKVGYLWSFYHNDKIELSVGAGLHLTRVELKLQANSTTPPANEARDGRSTVPLPVLSFGLNYNVTSKLSWFLRSEIFSISLDDWTGTYTDSSVGIEYRAWRNIGLGAGIGSNSLKIQEETSGHKFQYENRITGANFYVAAYF